MHTISRFLVFASLAYIALAVAACSLPLASDPTDPDSVRPTWEAQSCPASVTARGGSKIAFMDIPGKLSNFAMLKDTAYMLVERASIRIVQPGRVDVDYGGGHKLTVYPPKQSAGTMQIERWNGVRQPAIFAGAGKVIENASLDDCAIEILAGGKLRLRASGTEFVFVVRPETWAGEEVQVAVFSGEVTLSAADGQELLTLGAQQAVIVTDGAPGPVFPLPDTPNNLTEQLENGNDLFGAPQDDLQPGSQTQFNNGLDELIGGTDPSYFWLILPFNQEPAIPFMGESLAARGYEYQVLMSSFEEIVATLQIRIDAGDYSGREVILLVNTPVEWYSTILELSAMMGMEQRVFSVNTESGLIQPVK